MDLEKGFPGGKSLEAQPDTIKPTTANTRTHADAVHTSDNVQTQSSFSAEEVKLQELRQRAAQVKEGRGAAGSGPVARKTYEVDEEEIRKHKAEMAKNVSGGTPDTATGTVAVPRGWQPPRAEAVEPVPADEGYTFRDAVKDAGGLSAPPLDEALKAMLKGEPAAKVVAEWGRGGEALP